MRIVVLGAGGQLASDILLRLSNYEVTPMTRERWDLTSPEQANQALDAVNPEVVINCAAYNLVDQAEAEPAVAFANNAIGVGNVAKACGQRQVRLIHVSTDYVFGLDATRKSPWLETDAPGPVSAYGASKLAGEYAVLTHCPKGAVLRTCGLYGHKGSRGKGGNFVETMLRLASTGKPVRVVSDQICCPTSTAALADAIVAFLSTSAAGLYHATCQGETSWHDFAAEIFRASNLAVDLTPIPSREYPTPAKRPPYSVLSGAKLASLGILLPDWRDALRRYLEHRKPFSST